MCDEVAVLGLEVVPLLALPEGRLAQLRLGVAFSFLHQKISFARNQILCNALQINLGYPAERQQILFRD